jgi:hypothetical protein
MLVVIFESQAFIMIDKNYRLSKPEDTTFKISSEGCTAAGISDAVLKSAMKRTAEMWNDVPESRLKVNVGGTSTTSVSSTTIPKGEVIIGCAALGDASLAGVANVDNANGSGRIRMNSEVFSASQLVGFEATVIHEFGHTVGLGHSKDPASVMTYEPNGWNNNPAYLSQDDVDGVVYLYPNKEKVLGGLLASCDSYAADGGPSEGQISLDFIIGFLAVLGIWKLFCKIFKRA